jgi:hypothetical protein
MKSLCNFALSGLRVATLLGLLVCGVQSVANAGVLTYTAGTGGTFDPSTVSTFTFTGFTPGTLVSGVSYTDIKVVAKWGGTTPYPGAFSITGVSTSNPTTTSTLPSINFLTNTASGSVIGYSAPFVTLSSIINDTNVAGLNLTLTIPTLTVPDGWTLSFAVQATDNGANTNQTAFQTVTAFNSASVPEPGTSAVAGGLVALAIFVQRRRAKRVANIDNNAV